MTDERIVSIAYLGEDECLNTKDGEEWMGYTIQTTKQTIQVLINVYQQCCEKFDVAMITPKNQVSMTDAEDREIIGSKVLRVGWAKKIHPDYLPIVRLDCFAGYDVPHAVVDIQTDKGLYQFIAYNNHNDYYPHDIKVSWKNYADVQRI
jgi:hypothetical protein